MVNASPRAERKMPTIALLLIVLAFAGATLGPAHALQCVDPSEWGRFRILDTYTDEEVALIPYSGTVPGYGCNVGNLHAIEGPWFAWMEAGAGEHWDTEARARHPGPVHVLHLATGDTGTVTHVTDRQVHGLSVITGAEDAPQIHALTRHPEGGWSVHRVAPALDGTVGKRLAPLRLQGDQAMLQGPYVVLLDDAKAQRPTVTLYDARAERELQQVVVPTPETQAPPWILLAGDGVWIVVGTGEWGQVDNHLTMAGDQPAWAYHAATGKLHEIPQPKTSDGEPRRHGFYRLDGSALYRELWDGSLPWYPSGLERLALPPESDKHLPGYTLLRGIEVEGGWLVTGEYLRDGPPGDPRPVLNHSADLPRGPETTHIPNPGFLAISIASGLVGAAWIRRRRHA